MAEALDEIEYLARSENRLVVLRTLATEPMARDALREETGGSRQTLARILSELEERGWVDRAGVDYRATTLGAYLAREFEAFTLAAPGTPTVLQPGESITVTVAYGPRGPGPTSDSLVIESDDPDEPVVTIPLDARETLPDRTIPLGVKNGLRR